MSFRVLLTVCLLVQVASAAKFKEPKKGTYYPLGAAGISKMEPKGSRLHVTFKPKDEQFHWCPGIKVKTTDVATIVTFVRCKTSASCSVDKKAAIGRKLVRTVTIDTRNKDTYVYTGPKQFKRIHEVPKDPKEKTKESKEAAGKTQSAQSTSNVSSRSSRRNSVRKSSSRRSQVDETVNLFPDE